jgi:hypothetical protein
MRLRRPVWKTCCSADSDKLEDDADDETEENIICCPLAEEEVPFVRVFRKASMQEVQLERDALTWNIINRNSCLRRNLNYVPVPHELATLQLIPEVLHDALGDLASPGHQRECPVTCTGGGRVLQIPFSLV